MAEIKYRESPRYVPLDYQREGQGGGSWTLAIPRPEVLRSNPAPQDSGMIRWDDVRYGESGSYQCEFGGENGLSCPAFSIDAMR
ncbi:MAG: hypothetical protein DCC75_08775 [Proteobacteria bacterium]|nr:MAG: hypothetical protein DCC75_08775 [Pseudomonadota bacterium]